jgi:intracellular septation protein
MQVALKHLLLDFLSNAFFLVVIALTGNVILAVALGLAVGLIQIAVQKYLGVPVPPIQLMALGLVVVLGGAALISNDSRFVMLKPSIRSGAAGSAGIFQELHWKHCLPSLSTVPDTLGRL